MGQPNTQWQESGSDSAEQADESDDQQSNQPNEESGSLEVVEPEVVDTPDIQPAEAVDALSTFTESEGPFSFKVIPVIKDTVTDWRVVVYRTGVQGPVYESTEKLSDAAAAKLGMSRRLQQRINDAVEYADRNLHIPEELGDQTRQKRSLHELEVLMDKDE